MAESSLAASIFGGGERDSKGGLSLTNIFESSHLPEKPNKQNFTEPASKREKRERKEEKKRKRKNKKEESQAKPDEDKNEDGDSEVKDQEDTTTATDEDEERTIFVGNLPNDATRKSLASMFKSCGKVKSARIRSVLVSGVKVAPEHAGNQNLVKKVSVNTNKLLQGPKNTSQGYVVFEGTESIEKALKLNNTPISNSNGLLLRVDRAKPTVDTTRSVFVGNLPYAADEMSLREHFKSGCGFEEDVIENVRIVRDSETMQCKGFGYVLVKDKSYVPYALEMHKSEYKKREIRVMVCGKRFKGRKGGKKEGERVNPYKRRKEDTAKKTQYNIDNGIRKPKKKRGVKKTGAHKAGKNGISKRAESKKKENKRVKQIQKRIQRGMGKTKK